MLSFFGVAQGSTNIDVAFQDASRFHHVDLKLLRAVCFVESGHRAKVRVIFDQKNLNKKGAPSHGLCQMQLATARYEGFTGTPKELLNPSVNAFYAAKHLKRWLNKTSDWKLAVSAYNRGHFRKTMRIGYVCKVAIAMLENR